MKWSVAACGVLLLLLALVWWLDAEKPADPTQMTAPAANVSTNFRNLQPLKQVEVASDGLTSTTIGVEDKPEPLTANASHLAVDYSLQPGCLRKEKQPDAEFELNAAVRNEGAGEGSSTLNKEACFTAVREIKSARWMFDATPTQTIAYSPLSNNWHGLSVQEIVLHELCGGDQPFDAALQATVELFFVTAKETTKVLIGPRWVSEGTIRSPLTEEQYSNITKTLLGRRRDVIGPGGNMSAEIFDKRFKERYFNRVTAEAEAQEQRAKELRRVQRGLPADCVE
ncbi:MAG: hypothetical protein H7Y02_07730 [Candidatus Obscuribacterales bacterium]|nr:hypothetical protein [Steroidobacteraceae bacterium]